MNELIYTSPLSTSDSSVEKKNGKTNWKLEKKIHLENMNKEKDEINSMAVFPYLRHPEGISRNDLNF